MSRRLSLRAVASRLGLAPPRALPCRRVLLLALLRRRRRRAAAGPQGQYPLEQPNTLGMLLCPVRRPTVIERWSPFEIAVFEGAILLHGKCFHTLQKFIKTKTTKEVIEFYYMWKKTSHYEQWKERFVPDALMDDSDGDADGDGDGAGAANGGHGANGDAEPGGDAGAGDAAAGAGGKPDINRSVKRRRRR